MKGKDTNPEILEILHDDSLSNAETNFTLSNCSEPEHGAFLEGKSTATWYPNYEENDFESRKD